MLESVGVFIALLAEEEDEDQRDSILIGMIVTLFHVQQLKRLRNRVNQSLLLLATASLRQRNDPSGAYAFQRSPLLYHLHGSK